MALDIGLVALCLGLPAMAAGAAVWAYEIPSVAGQRLAARMRAAVKRANVEAAGLRRTLEGFELRLRDMGATTAGIDPNLRHKIQKMPARDQAALDALIGQGTFDGLLNVLRNGVLVDRRVAELQRSWARGAGERQSTLALCENLWVLEPGLVDDGHVFLGKTLGVVAESYFGVRLPRDDLAQAAAKKKPSAVGMFRRRSAISNPQDPGVRTLVILETRRPGDVAGQAVVAAAIGYAHAIRKLAPAFADWPIECLVVAGSMSTEAHFAASQAPPGVPVHLTTWDALVQAARARRPETVNLRGVRFDADNPPSYSFSAQPSGLAAILDVEDDDGASADRGRA